MNDYLPESVQSQIPIFSIQDISNNQKDLPFMGTTGEADKSEMTNEQMCEGEEMMRNVNSTYCVAERPFRGPDSLCIAPVELVLSEVEIC